MRIQTVIEKQRENALLQHHGIDFLSNGSLIVKLVRYYNPNQIHQIMQPQQK